MKNLFDFATKELSQDAFLRWLLENWNDKDIGPISLEFLKLLTGKKFEKKDIDEERTTSWAQAGHMDIVFDIFIHNENQDLDRYLLAIEDKSFSQEHSHQLDGYTNTLKEWQRRDGHKEIYRVYYKTGIIDRDEEKRVNDAEWKIIPFEKIVDFFKPYVNYEKSDVLRDYARHVQDLWSQSQEAPSGDPRKWTFTQWDSFFRYSMEEKLGKIGGEAHVEKWVWRGRHYDFAFYYHYKDGIQPLVYFSVNKGSDDIIAKIYLTTEDKKDKWTWKPCNKSNGFRNCLKDELEKRSCQDLLKLKKVKNSCVWPKRNTLLKLPQTITRKPFRRLLMWRIPLSNSSKNLKCRGMMLLPRIDCLILKDMKGWISFFYPCQ